MTTRAQGLALFGGAFDPPHVTHRAIAEAALRQLPVRGLRVLITNMSLATPEYACFVLSGLQRWRGLPPS